MPPNQYQGRGADTGQASIRDMQGVCDLCGDQCFPNEEICVALACTFSGCDSELYHQGCVEKYLKSHKLEMSRKAGFACPRGYSKITRYSERCKGKVDKSHPIVPRSEKRTKAKALPPQLVLAQQQAAARAAGGGGKPPPMAPPKPKKAQLPGAVPRKAVVASRGIMRGPVAVSLAPSPVAAPEPEDDQPKELPPGMTLEMALSKAQRKNLKKKLARKGPEGSEAAGDETASTRGGAPSDAGASSSAPPPLSACGDGGGGAAALMAGHSRFVTDPAQYAKLLGLYMDSDEEEELAEEEGYEAPAPLPDAPDAHGLAPGSGGGGGGALAAALAASVADEQASLAAELAAERAALEGYEASMGARGAGAAAAVWSPAPVPVPIPVPVPVRAAPAACAPPGAPLGDVLESLLSKMLQAPALAFVVPDFLDAAADPRAAELLAGRYAELDAAVERGDASALATIVARSTGGGAAPAALAPRAALAAAAPPAPVPAYVAPRYVAAPAGPAPAALAPAAYDGAAGGLVAAPTHAHGAHAQVAWASTGLAFAEVADDDGAEGDEADDLDDLLALCGVEA